MKKRETIKQIEHTLLVYSDHHDIKYELRETPGRDKKGKKWHSFYANGKVQFMANSATVMRRLITGFFAGIEFKK